MKRLNYIDLGVHKGQEIDMVLKDYAEYQHKFDLFIYGVEASLPLFLKIQSKYEGNYRVKLFHNAICEDSGRVDFYISKGRSKLGSSIYSSKHNVNIKKRKSVYGYSFFDFVNKNVKYFDSSINVLKLNIEGAELSVYESLVKNNMIKKIDLFCGYPGHDIEKIPEFSNYKKKKYYSLMDKHNIKLKFLCGDSGGHIARSINIFEAL